MKWREDLILNLVKKQLITGNSSKVQLPRWILVLLGIFAGWALCYQSVFIPKNLREFYGIWGNKVDLQVYMLGAHRFLTDQRVYETKIFGKLDYTYTPFSTMVFSVFDWISPKHIYLLWNMLSLVSLLVVVLLCFRSLGYRMDWRVGLASLSLSVIFLMLEPVRATVWFGQINLLLLVIVLSDILRSGRFRGLGVGLAAGIKLTPAFFIVYSLAIKKWRYAAAASSVFFVSILLGFVFSFADSKDYWFSTLHDPDRVGRVNSPGNQSLSGALSLMDHHHLKTNLLVYLPLAVLLCALGLVAAVLAYRAQQILLALIITGLTTTAVSPMSWMHHWVWSVPLLVFVLHLFIQAVARKNWGTGLATVLSFIGLYIIFFDWTWQGWGYRDGRLKPHIFQGFFLQHEFPELRWFTTQSYLYVFGFVVAATVLWHFSKYRRRETATDLSGIGD